MLTIFLALAIAALLMAALLNRRHRPQLLTTCLALSIVLHLLSLSIFSIVHMQAGKADEKAPVMPGARKFEVGSYAVRESRMSRSIRTEALKTETVDAHSSLDTVRTAKREPIKNAPARAQAELREGDVRTAGRVALKTPDIVPPKQSLAEPLDAVPDRPIEASPLPIVAALQSRSATKAEQTDTGERSKTFDVAQAAQATPTQPNEKPNAPLKLGSQAPARASITLAAAPAARQQEVGEALQPVHTGETLDRLADRAVQIDKPRVPASDERTAGIGAGGSGVKLGKRAGATPQPGGRRMAAVQPVGRARLVPESLAAESPGSIERRKNEVGGYSPDAVGVASRLAPIRLNDAHPLVAGAHAGTPGPFATRSDNLEWASLKENSIVPDGLESADGKPRALVLDIAPSKESKDPSRIGLGGGALAGLSSQAPSVRDSVSVLPGESSGLGALKDRGPAISMAMVPNDRKEPGPAANQPGPSELTAAKRGGGLGDGQSAAVRVSPARDFFAGSKTAGAGSGTLVQGSGIGFQPRAQAGGGSDEKLAGVQAGVVNQAGLGLTDIGSPVKSVSSASQGASNGGGQGIQPVALAIGKKRRSGASAVAAGGDGVTGVARPSPTGRSAPRAGYGSFVGSNAGGAGSPSESTAIREFEQVGAAGALTIADGGAKDLAGRMNVERYPGTPAPHGAGGYGGGAGGQSELFPGKAGGGVAADTDGALQRFQAPGGSAGGAPAASVGKMLISAGLQPEGPATASGKAGKELLAAMNTSASSADSIGLAIMASTASTLAQPSSGVETGLAPAQSLQVGKANGGDPTATSRMGGGGLGDMAKMVGAGAGERNPSRMEVHLNAVQSKARETADISMAGPGKEALRTFLTVGNAPNPAFVPQKAIYQMRKPEKRRQFIKELGGTKQTEEAVEKALAWLGSAQSDDGRWDVDGFKTLKECGGAGDLVNEDMVVTGMSLLTYLGAGYTHIEGEHKETVRKGLDWLLNCEKENGDFRGAGQMYGQAIATAVLCESYSLTGDKRLLAPARRAVQFIVKSQTAESGWRYAPRDENDTSVTGWQILALKSAQIAGIEVPEQTFKWTKLWLDKVRQGHAGGLYSYKVGHVVTPVMTAEGAFCQLFTGARTKTPETVESIAFLMNNQPAWDPRNRSVNMYYWYYATLAIYLSGAQEFEAWNAALTKALLKGRNTSGPAAGSWDPVDQLGPRGGRIYSTAIGALCLEVYYRFLPLYKQKSL